MDGFAISIPSLPALWLVNPLFFEAEPLAVVIVSKTLVILQRYL